MTTSNHDKRSFYPLILTPQNCSYVMENWFWFLNWRATQNLHSLLSDTWKIRNGGECIDGVFPSCNVSLTLHRHVLKIKTNHRHLVKWVLFKGSTKCVVRHVWCGSVWAVRWFWSSVYSCYAQPSHRLWESNEMFPIVMFQLFKTHPLRLRWIWIEITRC